MVILTLISILLCLWIGLSTIYISINSISAFFYQKKTTAHVSGELPSTLVLIPAYKEDNVIKNVAKKAVEHDYIGHHDVVIIADSLKKSTVSTIRSYGAQVIEVQFEKSTKSKSINKALDQIEAKYDLLVLLDADNIMSDNALNIFASEFQAGKQAMQGRRTALNLDSQFAKLDAISEEVNNHLYCAGPNALRMSSRLVGSGMAFSYDLFRKTMTSINAVGGFDKELELSLIEQNIPIHYIKSAIVLDEKVPNPEVFQTQRRRWISAQYYYLKKNFKIAFMQTRKGNMDYLYKYLQLALPPRLLIPIAAYLCAMEAILFEESWIMWAWIGISLMITIAYAIAIPKKFYNVNLLKSLTGLPKAIWSSIFALIKIKGANKTFIHTPHGSSH